MSIPRHEQETVISWYRDSEADVYTSDTTMITRMDKLVAAAGSEWHELTERRGIMDGQVISKTYRGPRDLVTIRTAHRHLSEEERTRTRERLANGRKALTEAHRASER